MNQSVFNKGLVSDVEYLPYECIEQVADVKDPNAAILDFIFGVDKETGMPTGDLAVYTGNNANPEVKAFIQQNLLNPNSVNDSNLSLPQDVLNKFKGKISDDDIAQFSRNHDEDIDQYAVRMRNYFDSVRAKNEYDAQMRKLKKIVDDSAKSKDA